MVWKVNKKQSKYDFGLPIYMFCICKSGELLTSNVACAVQPAVLVCETVAIPAKRMLAVYSFTLYGTFTVYWSAKIDDSSL
jgi:hypothetical protein